MQRLHSDSISNLYQQDVNSNDPRIKFGWKLNGFNEFLVGRMIRLYNGVKLKKVYAEYRNTLEYHISDKELLTLSKGFYDHVKDTEMFLLKREYVPTFPKTSSFRSILIKDI